MRIHRALPVAALAVALPAFAADFRPPPDGSADQVMTMKDGKTITSKVYFAGNRTRAETMGAVVVIDQAAKKQWVVLPAPMGCLEQPLKEDPKSMWTGTPGGDTKIELVGKETIDGHPAEKHRISGTANGKPFEHFVWRATDLKGFPVKQASADGSYEAVFKNIKLGRPDAKLFQKPGDCKAQLDFGAMMKAMQQNKGGAPGSQAPEGEGAPAPHH